MNNFFNWLTISSQDPEKTSLTVKGILTTYIPLILIFLPVVGIHIDQLGATQIIDSIQGIIVGVLGIVGICMSLWGLIRKIVNTAKPTQPSA